MRTGVAISGTGHLVVLAWAAVAGLLSPRPSDLPVVQTAEVSLVSEAELAAARLARPEAETDVAAVTAPDASPRDVTLPQTDAPVDNRDAVRPPTTQADTAPEALAPPETGADAQTDIAEIALPGTEDAGARLIVPPRPNPSDRQTVDRPSGAAPVPTPGVASAPRVDTTAAPKPEDGVRRDTEDRVAATAEAADKPVTTETEDTAREAASTEIVTEAKEGRGDAAPASSLRPRRRPQRVADNGASQGDTAAAIAAALAQAQAEARASAKVPDASEPLGPPLTRGEKDALRVAVQKCWNVGALSSDALRVTVEVAVSLDRDGKPQIATIRMLGYRDGDEAAARQAYEAARRAIVRCGAKGYDLPPEKYAQWRDIEMTFNPTKMRVK